MKTLLLTGFDDKMAPIGELTSPLMEDYAKCNKMDYRCWRQVTAKHPAYWEKIPRILDAFSDGYDRVVWLDADQMVTAPELGPWKRIKKGFHASLDWGQDATADSHFSMCGFTACRDTVPLFEFLEHTKADWVDKPFPEQAPMRWLYEQRYGKHRMVTHPRRMFNAVPIEVHPTVQEPWQPGDWCAHLTMLPVPERVALFHKIKKKL